MNAAEVLERSREIERHGSLLDAYDMVLAGIDAHPGDLRLRHRAVLLLARAGSLEFAARSYRRLGLDVVDDDADVIALGGRLLKDQALAAHGAARRRLARGAAAKYEEAYRRFGSAYAGVNVAAMRLLAGDAQAARTRAAEVLSATTSPPEAETAEDAYFRVATRAEAELIAGRQHEAAALLAEAIACDPENHPARAATLRQFALLSGLLELPPAWLDPFRPAPVVHFCGHMFRAGQPLEAAWRETLREVVDRLAPSTGFGALASGADIVLAELLLARGAALHVVLPVEANAFVARSVAPLGADWVPRFNACRDAAASVRVAAGADNLGDDAMFAYGSAYAMGLALLHARDLQAPAVQIAAWDGQAARGTAGTGSDVATWRATGRNQVLLPFPSALQRTRAPEPALPRAPTDHRVFKAMLFGDVSGFSRLKESQIRPFVESILAPLAAEIGARATAPDLVATWGDGFHIVCRDAADAADLALALRDAFSALPHDSALPDDMGLRIGAHFGPVTQITDPFVGRPNFYGTHVTVAARIEPVTIPGAVFLSEPMAAQLALAAAPFAAEYAGLVSLPKGFGTSRLFALRASSGDARAVPPLAAAALE